MESINFPKPQFVCSASQTPSGNCHSAIIFSGPRLRQLENFQRFPATYIGVRRVRPSGGAKLKICDKSLCSSLKNREGDTFVPNDLGADKSKHAFDGNDVIATDIAVEDRPVNDEKCGANYNKGRSENPGSPSLHGSDASERTQHNEIVYKIIDADGIERRMTKQEKKHAKNEIRLAKQRAYKEEKQKQHWERIRIAKEEGRVRRKLKRAAWKQMKDQQKRKEKGHDEALECCDQPEIFSKRFEAGRGLNDKVEKNILHPIKLCTNDNVVELNFPLYNETHVDEELVALKGEKRGIPPVLLTPAATSVAVTNGSLKMTPNETDSSIVTQKSAIMDPELSRAWALQLKASMIPVEVSRAKENMRPMAYEVVPEVWRRLCPENLWNPSVDVNEKDLTVTRQTKVQSIHKKTEISMSECNDIDVSSSTTQQKEVLYSFVPIRNPTSSYDLDAQLIFQHLYRHTNFHISCGAIFGCDFLLYDGKREDRHSFAGIRLYSAKRTNVNEEGGCMDFPIPTAFDIMGYVRAMNTARKLALVATVIHPETSSLSGFARQNGPKIALVDLVLEKVLEVETHLKKGNTIKRRSEEEAASALDKKKMRAII